MKTIKQIANELSVSKTTVRKKIENLGLQSSLRKNGKHFEINNEQEKLIKASFLHNETQTKNENLVCEKTETRLQLLLDLVSTYQQQLDILNRELDVKNKQIDDLNKRLAESQKLLYQQQQLNAITEQKIKLIEHQESVSIECKLPKKWYEFWK